jgi:YVTN family beta-propeller protein
VANSDTGTVSVIDSNNMVVDTVDVGSGPIALEYNPANNFIYVANGGSNTVSVIPS